MCLGNTRHWLLADSGSGLSVCPRGYWDVVAGSVSLVAAFLDGCCWAGLAWGWQRGRRLTDSSLRDTLRLAERDAACPTSEEAAERWVEGGGIVLAVPTHLRKAKDRAEKVGYRQNRRVWYLGREVVQAMATEQAPEGVWVRLG